MNSFRGVPLGGGSYLTVRWADWQTGKLEIADKDGQLSKELAVHAPLGTSKMYLYYAGTDGADGLYLRVDLEREGEPADDIGDNLFLKYDRQGNLLATVDALQPLAADQKGNYYYTDSFENIRVSKAGDIYCTFFFPEEGMRVYKYARVE